jgi:hypothetical protein
MISFNDICITLDIDWANDEIIEYSTKLLEKYNVKATIFATHESELLKSLEKKFEIGIHPNFVVNHRETINELLQIYPNAIGVRSHGCHQSTNIFRFFISKGLKYDSTTYIPLRENLYPWWRLKKLVCIPFFWSDDTMFYSGLPFDFSQLHLLKSGLKVYVFHPIHVFANTQSEEHYRTFKAFYHQQDKLINFRGKGRGIQTLFVELLKYLQQNNIESYTCKKIYQKWLSREVNIWNPLLSKRETEEFLRML